MSSSNAKVSVSKSSSGKYTVKLLDNVTLKILDTALAITSSMIIDLNEKCINIDSEYVGEQILIDSDEADVIIKGGKAGTIQYICQADTSKAYMILISRCKSFIAIGGQYKLEKPGSGVTVMNRPSSAGVVKIYNAKVECVSTTNVTSKLFPSAIRIQGGGGAIIENCTLSCVGKNAAVTIWVVNYGKVVLNNNKVLASAAEGDANVYDADQTYGIALHALTNPVEINGGFYSGEVAAITLQGQGEAKINGATIESCDHGLYFSGERCTIRNSKLVFKKWSELECAKLTFPESVIAGGKKTQYSATLKDYGNTAPFYIGSSKNVSKVYMDNCEIVGAKGVLSSNQGYLDTYLYASNTNFVYGLRIDSKGHAYMGKGSVCSTDKNTGDGLYDVTTYANTTF